jgi:hypothetical protein
MAPEPHIVVLLGTGSTVGAECEPVPPGDWNFFKHSRVQELLENGQYPALKWGRDRFAPCSLEDLVAQTDLLAKLCALGILSEERDYWSFLDSLRARADKDKSYAAKLAMEAPCIALPALVAWEAMDIACDVLGSATLNPLKTGPLVKLLNALLDRDRRLTIASLNYDLVLEQALLQLLGTGRAFRYGEADPPTVGVLKLHGSLNWKEAAPDFSPHMPDWGGRDWLKVERPFASGSRVVQPSLLLPTLFKQEININYQTDRRAMHYKTLWEVFAARLSSATALLIVGCSLPDTDRHLRAVVESAIKAGNGNLRRVVVCVKGDPGPIDRLQKIVPDNVKVCGEDGGLAALVIGDKVDWLTKEMPLVW